MIMQNDNRIQFTKHTLLPLQPSNTHEGTLNRRVLIKIIILHSCLQVEKAYPI